METIINVPFTDINQATDYLNKKSLKELKKSFEFEKEQKSYYKNVSFDKHMLYYDFMIIRSEPNLDYPSKEIQSIVLLEAIYGFEKYIDYEIEAIGLTNGDSLQNHKYYLKGKFTDEKQFYIFFLTR